MFLAEIPEAKPALLSLIYVGGAALLALILFVSLLLVRRRKRSALEAVAPSDLPPEVRKRLGGTSTNRGLRALRWVFVLLALGVFSSHVYWAQYAAESNERFQELSYKDLRNRRLAESTLRGWILDRTGSLDKALALYRRAPNGQIVRDYPLDTEMSQLLGSDRGDPGLERSLFGIQSSAAPEAWDVLMGRDIKQQANLDVRLTIDNELQRETVALLRGRHGAAVVLNPQTGEVLALYSNPSYSLKEVQDEETWIRMNANDLDRPLVNRALRGRYIPGSTFKTAVMLAAFNHGLQGEKFNCSGAGFYAERGARPIFDSGGTGEVHGSIGIDTALEVSCNQYFAQMAIKLGPDRLAESLRHLGMTPVGSPQEALGGGRQPEIWNVSQPSVARALAPVEATVALYRGERPYDLGLIGFGQGYAGQMTPFHMALVAAAVGNLEGKVMKPKIEYDRLPEMWAQAATPAQAAEMRRIMGLVTAGSSGTATSVLAPVHAQGIITGGKTGTAEKQVPLYDKRTGEMLTEKKIERDPVLRLALRWMRQLPTALAHMRDDVSAACANDPAARSPMEVILTYPGIHALWAHRVAHDLWSEDSRLAARLVSHASRFVTGVEIHPGARIGRGVFIDHGMGVVIGETATVGDGCLLYKGVVLGGTSLENRVRHPQLGANVIIGSNACILGNITVGDGARIGSGSVVVKPVPAGATVVGVPARIVPAGVDRHARFAAALDHANLPDPVTEMIRALAAQNERLRHRVEHLEQELGVASPDEEAHHDEPPFMAGEAFPKLEGG